MHPECVFKFTISCVAGDKSEACSILEEVLNIYIHAVSRLWVVLCRASVQFV